MSTSTVSQVPSVHTFEKVNWVASDPLERDQEQSHHLHEPGHRINTIDPMTGHDIEDVAHHPCVDDGDLTIYFETDATRQAFIAMPVDHPNVHLPFPASDEDDRGG